MQTDLRLGDCLEVLSQVNSDSIDTVITDPPYGLGFMGKDWDTFKVNYIAEKTKNHKPIGHKLQTERSASMHAGSYDYSRNAEFQQWFTVWAKEVLRVCKPGAMALVFGSPRTYHRLACAMEDAGFEIRDCLCWLYGSGFPKSLDISKAIDAETCREQLTEELGRPPTRDEFKKAWKKWREVVGENPNCRPNCEGKLTRAMAAPITVQPLTAPATDLAKLWNGWGTALKPAYEPILLCMKPCEGTFAENAERWGVAGLAIDLARIPAEKTVGARSSNKDGIPRRQIYAGQWNEFEGNPKNGRWPANLLLDEESALLLDQMSGMSKSRQGNPRGTFKKGLFANSKFNKVGTEHNDSGGASRFFYVAKSSRSERNAGLEDLPKKQMYKCDNSGQSLEIFGTTDGGRQPRQNFHPTVKPLKLMEYLCLLTKTPTGGVVLDPFMGSGTTGIACVNTSRDFIGIEKEKDYFEIAKRRIEHAKKEKLF